MKRTMPYTGAGYPPWWQVSQSYEFQGQTVVRGQALTIRSQRGGRFTFYDHVIAPPRPGSGKRKTAEWVTVLNQSGQAGQFRSFRPDQIGRIMRLKRKARAR